MSDHAKFLKGVGKAATSALAYLKAHEAFLRSIPSAAQVLAEIDAGKAFPTPSLSTLARVVAEDQIERLKGVSVKVAPAKGTKVEDTPKVIATLMDGMAEIKSAKFGHSIAASEWLARRMEENPGTTGKVTSPDGFVTTLDRNQASAILHRRTPMQSARVSKSDGVFRPKNAQTTVRFSHG